MTVITAPATIARQRTREDGHTAACLASAMKCAVENFRDMEDMTDSLFRSYLADGTLLDVAEGYLADNTATCACGPYLAAAPYAVGDTVHRVADGAVGTVTALDHVDRFGAVVDLDSPRLHETLVQVDLVDGADTVGVLGTVPAFRPVYCVVCFARLARTVVRDVWVSTDADADAAACTYRTVAGATVTAAHSPTTS